MINTLIILAPVIPNTDHWVFMQLVAINGKISTVLCWEPSMKVIRNSVKKVVGVCFQRLQDSGVFRVKNSCKVLNLLMT